ncbi:hypothetical protein [Streptomyces gilvosporeus]|uniref:Lipoprotein n=1 Tax=Streptomyces gilvosporeus TaxID=553510 RepID=A0A1V0TMR3_9ACTN|nr:hypothetical protein [Streptomyces gilvosporeus]ARF54221.1 hypothetical protein B1H19_08455 [Streptomyces gilvosporeus]
MRRLIAVPTVLLALAAAGCGSGNDSGERPTGGAGGSRGEGPSPGASPPPSGPSAPVPGQPMSCGTIHDALGVARDVALFADPGADGMVGCAEAQDVMSEFFLRARRHHGEDPGSVSVRGWVCQYESGPTGTWISTCGKNELEMHTEDPSDEDSGPDSSTGPDDPGESQLPSIPDEPSDPMDQPSNEEL